MVGQSKQISLNNGIANLTINPGDVPTSSIPFSQSYYVTSGTGNSIANSIQCNFGSGVPSFNGKTMLFSFRPYFSGSTGLDGDLTAVQLESLIVTFVVHNKSTGQRVYIGLDAELFQNFYTAGSFNGRVLSNVFCQGCIPFDLSESDILEVALIYDSLIGVINLPGKLDLQFTSDVKPAWKNIVIGGFLAA